MAVVVFRPSGILDSSDSGLTPGPSTIWSDDSDATYSEVFDAWAIFTGASATATPTFDAIPAMVGGIVTAVSVDVRTSAITAGTALMTVFDFGYWPSDTYFNPTGSIADFTWSPSVINNANALANAMGTGTWFPTFATIVTSDDPTQADVTQRIYEITVTVTYTPANRVAPARRLYPRTDSNGITLGRFYPPPNTPQASGRIGSSSPY